MCIVVHFISIEIECKKDQIAYFYVMNKNLLFCICGILFTLMSACKKDEQPQPQPTQFSFSISDSLVIEHSGTQVVPVSVQSASNKSFIATFETLPPNAFLYLGGEIPIEANQSENLEFEFYQTLASPGNYTGVVRVAVPNENNAIQTKEIKLVYRPNCGYAFRNYTIGEHTFVSSGNLVNKSITCAYNLEGQLEVEGLTSYMVTLDLNCAESTVSMAPLLHLGNVVTCTGTIEGSEIALQFFNDGVLHSFGRIKF